tara:strand:+ start:284 stop:763 length:480 start_codon:yes stop_codon:yes gene_type:complete
MIIWFTGQPGSGKTTLAKALIKCIHNQKVFLKKMNLGNRIFHLDGDDLRDTLDNKDYSEKGRRKNIQFAIDMAKVLDNKGFIVIVSLVSPYRDMREKLKMERNIAEFYLHTTETRGREDYFVDDYEPPLHNFTGINTNRSIQECINEILNVYREMAAVS